MRRRTAAESTGPSQQYRLAKSIHPEETVPVIATQHGEQPAVCGSEMEVDPRSGGEEEYQDVLEVEIAILLSKDTAS